MEIQKTTDTGIMSKRKVLEELSRSAFCERINKMVDDCTVFQKDERTKLFQVQMINH